MVTSFPVRAGMQVVHREFLIDYSDVRQTCQMGYLIA